MEKKRQLTPFLCDDLYHDLGDLQTPGLYITLLKSGRKRWAYRRRLAGSGKLIRLKSGTYPSTSIATAREWARGLNLLVEAGTDPRVEERERRRGLMTVDAAHRLYMEAVREGRGSRAKRVNKPRTIEDKLAIYNCDVAPALGDKPVQQVTEEDLVLLVTQKGKTAKARANRLAAELKVFFGWASSLRGTEVGLHVDPARRLHDLKYPERPRSRTLSFEEIEWFFLALVDEDVDYRRGMLLWLLTAARLAEVSEARSDELVGDVWVIPAERTKNGVEHRIPLGPWGWRLMQSGSEWVLPGPRIDGPRSRAPWYKARNRVRRRMEALAGRPIERFTPHDFRRTLRSNTKRLQIDFETAEAMLNHVKKGLERTYDRYDLEAEKRASFLVWERELAAVAIKAGVSDALLVETWIPSESATACA